MEKFEFDPSELDAKIAEAYKDDREQTRLFKYKRANQVLTEGEVQEEAPGGAEGQGHQEQEGF